VRETWEYFLISSIQSYDFSTTHVWMWELDDKEDWAWNNWCFWIVVVEKTHESPLDSKRLNQSVLKKMNPGYSLEGWMLTLKLHPLAPDMKSQLIGKESNAGKDWGQEEKRVTEDETVGWHHQHNGPEFEQTPGDDEGQGSLVCCRGHRVRHDLATEQQQQILYSNLYLSYQSVQSAVNWLCLTLCNPWTTAQQASLSITNSWSLSIESVMPSKHLILCRPLLLHPQSFPASGSFQMSQLFSSGGRSIGVSTSTSVPPMNTQDWPPLGWTGWISLQSKGLPESPPTPHFKSINSSVLSFLYSPTLTSIHDYWKNHSLD